MVDNDTALEYLYYYELLRNICVDHTPRVASLGTVVDMSISDYKGGAAPNYLTGDNGRTDDNDSQAHMDDQFAQWESDPLGLLSLHDLT